MTYANVHANGGGYTLPYFFPSFLRLFISSLDFPWPFVLPYSFYGLSFHLALRPLFPSSVPLPFLPPFVQTLPFGFFMFFSFSQQRLFFIFRFWGMFSHQGRSKNGPPSPNGPQEQSMKCQ
jgi:hypothetical protein